MTSDDFRVAVLQDGGLLTGGPVALPFKAGWAKHPFKGSVAHYFHADNVLLLETAYFVRSLCGMDAFVTSQVPLLEVGNYPMCSRCDVKLLSKKRFG